MSKRGTTMLHVSFDVEASKLSLFMELLDKEVENLSIGQVKPDEIYRVAKSKKQRNYTSINRPSHMLNLAKEFINEAGIGGIVKTNANGVLTPLGMHLENGGYSAASASPVVSRLARSGFLKRLRPGEYQILKLV